MKNENKKALRDELKKDILKGLTVPVFVTIFALLGAAYGASDNHMFSYAILGGLIGLSWGVAFNLRRNKKS